MSSSAQRLLRGGPPDAWLAASTSAMPSSSSRLDGLNALDAFLAPPMTADTSSPLYPDQLFPVIFSYAS